MPSLNELIKNTPDGSLPELAIADTLDHVPQENRLELLTILCKKVKYNGVLELTGTDIKDLTSSMYRNDLSLNEINQLLYGRDNKSVSHLEDVVNHIKNLNFKVINERRNKHIYYIKAQRQPFNE